MPPSQKFQKAVNPVGEILSMKGSYHKQYDALHQNNSIDIDGHTVRENAKTYLMNLIKHRQFTGRGSVSIVSSGFILNLSILN